ncbi:MAG: hypothetical protein A2912_03895 [Candidatus Buchananbacteria bacterium RIFCSPLOWO2_01_FULL_40_23b]|uniref:Uncharacterized protein n=1 Tax=Candidatus Buchananbacteria bacterium RIFCSPLOWO2_01_FULL_40_23b TaxID=1797544 RepID=A0A1G1YN43_9BACT|nr:MAG: hypothetical protein A2912_03895 [Candidatus Buchananbacteria bacterium RIFCSPLOWO2_01_FULL_40_23b]
MKNDLTTIVFNTKGLREEGDYKVGRGNAINYWERKGDRLISVFSLWDKYVESVRKEEDKFSVVLREGFDADIHNYGDGCGSLYVGKPVRVEIPLPFGFEKLSFALPFMHAKEYCTEIKYLDYVKKGEKVVYSNGSK